MHTSILKPSRKNGKKNKQCIPSSYLYLYLFRTHYLLIRNNVFVFGYIPNVLFSQLCLKDQHYEAVLLTSCSLVLVWPLVHASVLQAANSFGETAKMFLRVTAEFWQLGQGFCGFQLNWSQAILPNAISAVTQAPCAAPDNGSKSLHVLSVTHAEPRAAV